VRQGRLVVFEGPEGAGKTTQLARLAARLEGAAIEAVAFREPGGTELGDTIRDAVLDPSRKITAESEALLFIASRAELVAERIRPSLDNGLVVLLDRFFLSTYAYQIAGRGLPEDALRSANSLATGGLRPDITILLQLHHRDGLSRAASRGPRDRMERTGDAFHTLVAAAFDEYATSAWQAAHPECGPIVRVEAGGGIEDVEARIGAALAAACPDPFAVLVEAVAT
jgi:dTMP kinase